MLAHPKKSTAELQIMNASLSASLENYIRVIYEIIGEQEAVRAKEIAARLDVSSASVTGALRQLAKRGLINYEPYGIITLTRAGQRAGEQLCRANRALRDFLVSVLSVDSAPAEEAACKLEHAISREIMDRFTKFFEFMNACPYAGVTWVKDMGFHCKDHNVMRGCTRCVNPAFEQLNGKRSCAAPRPHERKSGHGTRVAVKSAG